MNIQLIGTKKCKETQKGSRFLKERSIKFHFRNIVESPLKAGEWNKLLQQINAEELINVESSAFKKLGLEYKVYDIKEELMEHNDLLKLPIIRIDQKFYLGFNPEEWKTLFQN